MKGIAVFLLSACVVSMISSTHSHELTLRDVANKIGEWQIQAYDGHSILGFERELGSIWQNRLTCGACHLAVTPLDWLLSKEIVYKTLEKIGVYICKRNGNGNEAVCQGLVTQMGDVIFPQLSAMLLTPEYSCSRFIGVCSSPRFATDNPQEYIDRMISDKPNIIKNNDYIDKLYEEIKNDAGKRETLRVLHMSDLHMDLEYTVGSNKNCDEFICCMAANGPAPTPADAAREFGEYQCDLPVKTLESLFHYVSDMDDSAKPDLVLWTGDNVSHDIWNQTAHKNTEPSNLITDFVKLHWPEMPVFVTVGNHEFYPVNVEMFGDQQPILERLASHWIDWIDGDALEQFKKFGYYSIPLRSISSELSHVKLISLNTQAFNNWNWGLLSTLNDPGEQLAWLEKELRDCESKSMIAYIIGHIPPSTKLSEWSIRYKALTERFQHIIRYQGFGHAHAENFFTVRGTYDFKPLGSFHLAGSVTSYQDKNPSFRILEVDKETMLPIRMETHFLDLEKANQQGKAEWTLRYEFTKEYGVKDLSPSSLYGLTETFIDNPKLAVKFLKNRDGQGGPGSDKIKSCGNSCTRNLFCTINNANVMLRKDCLGLSRYDLINDLQKGNFHEYLFDPWVKIVE